MNTLADRQSRPSIETPAPWWQGPLDFVVGTMKLAIILPLGYVGFVVLLGGQFVENREMDAWEDYRDTCDLVNREDILKNLQPGRAIIPTMRWKCREGEYIDRSQMRPPHGFLANHPELVQAARCDVYRKWLPLVILHHPVIAICPRPERAVSERVH